MCRTKGLAMFKKNPIDDVILGTTVLFIIAAIPLLAILLFILRGALFIAGVACLVFGLIAYAISPAFREWFRALGAPLVQYKGLRLATDVKFYPSHSWARMEDEVLVGVDDLVQAALGPVDSVELPPNGTHVVRGQPLFRLHHGNRAVDVPSPVSGIVVGVNPALRGHPELINNEPFAHGWAVRIHSDDPRGDRKLLLRGEQARNWFRSAADRVIGVLPGKTGVAAEGSVSVGQLYRYIDDTTWRQLTETMFAKPSNELNLPDAR